MGFHLTGQLLIVNSELVKYLRKLEYNEAVIIISWRYSPGWALASATICLQVSRSLALSLSIRLYPSFSGPWTRHPAISFLVFLFVLLHTAFRTASFYNEAVHQLFIDFKKAYDSVRREVLCNILTEFVIPMKLVRLIKMCLNETRNRVQVGKHLSDFFSILLTLHLSIFILVINQLDAQHLFYNKFISCLYMFRASCAHR